MAPHSDLIDQARSLATSWRTELDLSRLIREQLERCEVLDPPGPIDVVAIGKAAGEMASATLSILGARVARTLVICDDEGSSCAPSSAEVVVGEHPLPGDASLRAGVRLLGFLASSTSPGTVFLVSGGASSLCVAPAAPLTIEDLHAIFRAALESGADITTLNRLRASTSLLGGGAVLARRRGDVSVSLIMVDNVVSGPEWVASGLTYDFRPSSLEVRQLVEAVGLTGGELAERIVFASEQRGRLIGQHRPARHLNRVVADPAMMLASVEREATARGYQVYALGSAVHDDVQEATQRWSDAIAALGSLARPTCVVGVGEVTVRVRGRGTGGRCQQFALSMAEPLAELDVDDDAVFVASSSDGRDYVEGVAGAWVDSSTTRVAEEYGIDLGRALDDNDAFDALGALGQLIDGAHTGWNLCDVYLALLSPRS